MNILIDKLNKELEKFDMCCVVSKETNTLLKGYLYDTNDYTLIGNSVRDYSNCKKLDVTYKKTDLYAIVNGKGLNDFCRQETRAYSDAKVLNMLRQ